ncbi:MAG: hypothetical protein R2861_02215 [Desulfobacterales bacterium]
MKERIFTDTSNFFGIDYGDIIYVGGKRFLIKGHEREERFGLDEPKFWVKKAVDLETGERKIIKLSFFESFETRIGHVRIPCFRHPDKEARVLWPWSRIIPISCTAPPFMTKKAIMCGCWIL